MHFLASLVRKARNKVSRGPIKTAYPQRSIYVLREFVEPEAPDDPRNLYPARPAATVALNKILFMSSRLGAFHYVEGSSEFETRAIGETGPGIATCVPGRGALMAVLPVSRRWQVSFIARFNTEREIADDGWVINAVLVRGPSRA
jgi:hypothetical protein